MARLANRVYASCSFAPGLLTCWMTLEYFRPNCSSLTLYFESMRLAILCLLVLIPVVEALQENQGGAQSLEDAGLH